MNSSQNILGGIVVKKHEFLRELENSLKGKLSEVDINEILSDYNDIFEDGFLENRDEDEISESIGSPAAISKAIIDDSTRYTSTKNSILIGPNISNLAPMSKRFLAYLIDTLAITVILILLISIVNYSTTYHPSNHSSRVIIQKSSGFHLFEWVWQVFNILTLLIWVGFTNIITAFELWLFKGYTLGKWMAKIKVVKQDNDTITFWDAFLRDLLIKFGASICVLGILNIISFIMGSATPDHKTVHDMAAKTKVINIER